MTGVAAEPMIPAMNSEAQGGRSAVVDLLADLVAFPTESLSTNLDLIDLYAGRAARAGAAIDVLPGEPGRSNLHVRFGPDAPGGILLSGHTDVVPAGAGWATDPYNLTEVDGQLRARGSADMKGFLAAALVVLESLDHTRFDAPVHLGLSYDEEVGCVGVHGLLDRLAGAESCAPTVVMVGEPTGMRLCNSHTGKVAYRVDVSARAGHSSRAATEPGALFVAADLVSRIGDLNSPGTGTSANVGTIHGGVAVNVLAPECAFDFELRFEAGVDPAEVLAGFWEEADGHDRLLAAVGGRVSSEQVMEYPALSTDRESEGVPALERLVGSGPPGPVGFGCEAGLYAERLGSPAVIVGPGEIDDAHRPDEFVEPEQLDRCVEVLHQTIRAFCLDPDPRE